MLVYIAGPYGRRNGASEEQIQSNVHNAIEAGRLLIQLGHTPVIPHLYHYVHDNWDNTPDENTWLQHCMNLLNVCRALIRLPGISTGADAEEEMAHSLGIPIYKSMEVFIEHNQRTP